MRTITEAQANYIMNSLTETVIAIYCNTKRGTDYSIDDLEHIVRFQFMEITSVLGITDVEVEVDNFS